ncbi:hypothetical protein [Pseudoalteromonas sp. Angola-4]|uniref:hypothetical protein n=1 Tax=Pseudoalteromonas sp. Angola-4 TaxID=3025335 RepID=UPI0023599D68|nr:hypothetical protein [Pseudoalteromonas sp. Angola-4]MDC9508080.1 hypothetical protein [Pseudoalteromonas sp. Angola-4]
MKKIHKKALVALILVANIVIAPVVYAHLMVAQHGTLNVIDNHAFIVLSLPISAFNNLDDDLNKKVSMDEFNAHKEQISKTIMRGVYLNDHHYKFSLEGLLLNPEVSHTDTNNIEYITITGRYTVPDISAQLKLNVRLFSQNSDLNKYHITATNKQQKMTHQFALTPRTPFSTVF